jgi:hypothetical protein
MLDSQLILFEGLPGSGKSTFASLTAIQAERNGIAMQWYHEVSQSHPTLFFRVACLDAAAHLRFVEQFPAARRLLGQCSLQVGEHVYVDLEQVKRQREAVLPDEGYQVLCEHDTWHFPMDKYLEIALERWQHFVDNVRATGERVTLESAIFQYQIYGLLLFDPPRAVIREFIHQLFLIIAPLRPALVYFYHATVDEQVRRLLTTRGQDWLSQIAERDAGTPYFQTSPLPGPERLIQLYREYRQLADDLFVEASMTKLTIDNSAGDWESYEREVLQFLQLRRHGDPGLTVDELDNLQGMYLNDQVGVQVEEVSLIGTEDGPALKIGGTGLVWEDWTEPGTLLYRKE